MTNQMLCTSSRQHMIAGCSPCKHTTADRYSGNVTGNCRRSCDDCKDERNERTEHAAITVAAVSAAEQIVARPATTRRPILGYCIDCGERPVYEGRGYHNAEMICTHCAGDTLSGQEIYGGAE